MLTGWLPCYGRNRLNLLLAFLAFSFVISAALAAQDKKPVVRKNISVRLKHIDAAKAKRMLKALNIGEEVNSLPGNSNIILITGRSSVDTRNARTLINVIDSERPYEMRKIASADGLEQLPDLDSIEQQIGNIKLGTFEAPPFSDTAPLAIVDKQGDSVIEIAPVDLLDTIQSKVSAAIAKMPQKKPELPVAVEHPELVAALEKLKAQQQAEKQQQASAEKPTEQQEPAKKSKSDEDFMQNELFAALAQAENQAAEPNQPQQQVVTEQQIVEAPQEDAQQEKGTDQVEEPKKDQTPEPADVQKQAQQPRERPGFQVPEGVTDPALLKALQMLAEKDKQIRQEQAQEEQAEQEPVKDEQTPDDYKSVDEIVQEEPTPRDAAGDTLDYLKNELSDEELETTLTIPERVEITALIELVGKQLGLNYIYDPGKVKGVVTLKLHEGKIRVRDTYALLETVLKTQGLVMTRRGSLVTIVPAAEALNYDPAFRTPDDGLKPGDVIATTVYTLDYVTTAAAATLLQNMKLTVDIQQIPETNTIIITEYAYRIGRVEKLLKMIDVPGEPKKFAYRQLKYTLASNLVSKLETLAEQLGTVSVTISPEATPGTAAPGTPRTPTQRRVPIRRPPTATPGTAAGQTQQIEGVYLDVDERTNRILMIGVEDDIQAVNELIDALDVQKRDLREIRQYEIENVGAEEVQQTLTELGIISGAGAAQGATRGRTTAARQPTPRTPNNVPQQPTTTTTATGEDILSEEPQVVVLEATNSLLVNATPEQHEQVAMVIAYVDAELEKAANPYVIYSLENQKPEELADVLSEILEAARPTPATGVAQEAGVQTERQRQEEEVIIVPDENTFSLIVYASRKKQEQIADLIEILDRRRPQVLIDVTLVEISKNESFNYDLELVTAFPDLDHTSGLLNTIDGTTTDDILDRLNNQAWDRNRFLDMRSSGGRFDAFYADNQIQGLLTLIQAKGYGRVLAQPQVLVNDNKEGIIDATNTIWVARTSQTTDPTTGQAIGAIRNETNFEDFESGINLTITPHISEGDLLQLDINLTRSNQEVTGTLEANQPPPPKRENTITTTVTVPDSSTIILGGIVQLNQTKETDKVPILGDLPIIGGLFRSIDNGDQQTKLYIFVKAHIVRPYEDQPGLPDLERISLQKRDAFEDAEREFQEYQSWPGIEPEPVDPLKVLDME